MVVAMSKDLLNSERAYIFRICHKGNIEKVLDDGGCLSRNEANASKYVEIGNQELIAKRKAHPVPCGPGGTLADYVPFYFTPFTPMLYNIKTGYNGVPKRPIEEIVILIASLHYLKEIGIAFVFTDKQVIRDKGIKSIALPPLGAGNGGLAWKDVRPKIEAALGDLKDVDVIVYEPTAKYQNVAKRTGVEKLTPTRALIAELVRRYAILGFDCTLLEIQKLGYFLERFAIKQNLDNSMKFQFAARKFGPYSENLKHLLNGLDGSYLHCDKRLGDAAPFDVIRFDDSKKDKVAAYLTTAEAKEFRRALEKTSELIDGFESPLGMELLATVDWLVNEAGVEPSVSAVRERLASWPGGKEAGERKLRLFEDRTIEIALSSLADAELIAAPKE